ncbi:HNH endonuclease [Streptomyces sp. NPDC091299]|uniref:HNH endonuclease n=1 Tax=Streptomyces sp. NPDC091299 TaxID=3155302 RepID=UPI00343F9118
MPISPPSRCGEPGCHALAPEGRCDEHKRKAWANRSKAWGSGSTRKWREFRAERLQAEPQCRWCGAKKDLEVDHIIPLSRGGSKWDPDNVQTLCEPCHEIKSEQDRRQRTHPEGSRLTF